MSREIGNWDERAKPNWRTSSHVLDMFRPSVVSRQSLCIQRIPKRFPEILFVKLMWPRGVAVNTCHLRHPREPRRTGRIFRLVFKYFLNSDKLPGKDSGRIPEGILYIFEVQVLSKGITLITLRSAKHSDSEMRAASSCCDFAG